MALEPQMSKLMSRLEWTWRLVMTGLCFALFGLGGLLLSVVWFNILLVLVWILPAAVVWRVAALPPVFACF